MAYKYKDLVLNSPASWVMVNDWILVMMKAMKAGRSVERSRQRSTTWSLDGRGAYGCNHFQSDRFYTMVSITLGDTGFIVERLLRDSIPLYFVCFLCLRYPHTSSYEWVAHIWE